MKPSACCFSPCFYARPSLSSFHLTSLRPAHAHPQGLRRLPHQGTRAKSLHEESGSSSLPDHKEETKETLSTSTKQKLRWADATVVENRAASVDGCVRLLVLSVEDHVDYLEGMKLKRIQKAPRWIDEYKLPGQLIGLRFLGDDSDKPSPQRLMAIACSPYEARRNSALLDASLIEVLVERDGHPDNEKMAGMCPGELLQASEVMGRGFTSLFAGNVGLLSALEESRPLLLVCVGTRGIAPLRAVLNWPPVQAMAAKQPITFIYIAKNQASAACLQDWDGWRDSGVTVKPIYVEDNGSSDLTTVAEELLERVIFDNPVGLGGLVGGRIDECGVLLSGLKGSGASKLTRKLRDKGVRNERLLFCEFF